MHKMMSKEYEKNVINEYHGSAENGNVFSDPNNPNLETSVEQIEGLLKERHFDKFHDWLRLEGRDLEVIFSLRNQLIQFLQKSLREAFLQREKYEKLKGRTEERQKADTKNFQDTAAGKSSFGAFFTRSPEKKDLGELESKIAQVKIVPVTQSQDN